MAISENLETFAGKPVVDWEPEAGITDPAGTIPRISLSYDDENQKWTDRFAEFLDDPAVGEVTGLVIGMWDISFTEGDSSPVVEALVAARDRLPNLTAIFFGDITFEECEISWIRQSDVSPLFDAYPNLEYFGVRGGDGLRLGSPRHERLKTLIVETGGLDASVVRSISAAHLPALEHLELWLGSDNYGANVTVEDLAPILSGDLFPNLRYLGLRDSEIADRIAPALAQAPILERIKVLDLSLGTLGDEGAAALLVSPTISRLEKLDIHHHFCSEEMVQKLQALGVEVDASDTQSAEEYDGESYRYIAVSE